LGVSNVRAAISSSPGAPAAPGRRCVNDLPGSMGSGRQHHDAFLQQRFDQHDRKRIAALMRGRCQGFGNLDDKRGAGSNRVEVDAGQDMRWYRYCRGERFLSGCNAGRSLQHQRHCGAADRT